MSIGADRRRPAILGGKAEFEGGLAFFRPATPPLAAVMGRLAPSYERGVLTNGPLVRLLEEQVANRLGARSAVAVSSCTAGLMLTLQALRPQGRVVLPSFTFSASAHAVVWNGLVPLFAECDPRSFQFDPADAAGRLSGAGALMATHVFGAPCPVEAATEMAATAGIPLLFDAAHGLGATRRGRAVGSFGTAEVFSLSPTKPVVAGEGGIVTTDDEGLAQAIRLGRDYGNPGDYNTRFAGLNARLSELHAAMAVESLAELDDHLALRRRLAGRYRSGLSAVPGVRPQHLDQGDESTYKDFTVAIDPVAFGISRDGLVAALRAEGIDTRCYFSPPVHRHEAYAGIVGDELPVTDQVASQVVSLPLYRSLSIQDLERVIGVVGDVHAHAEQVGHALTVATSTG